MIIGTYIRQLLTRNERVVLPGFGNLQAEESGRPFPASGEILNPPGLSVRFDTGISKDDGMLASAYAAGEELEEEEARQQVLELVDAIKFALDRGEAYSLPETGTFSRDEDGKVHFKIDPGWLLEPDQYGLDSINLLELEELQTHPGSADKTPSDESVRENLSETVTPITRVTPSAATSSVSTPRTSKPPEQKGNHVNRWRIIWIVAGSLIVVLAILIIIPVNRDENGEFKFGRNGIILKKTEVDPVEAWVETEISGETRPESVPDEMESLEAVAETDDPEVQHNFFIIAGSFQHLKNASDLQDMLKGKGFPSEVIITENRMYRVSVISYSTKEEAIIGLTGIKAEPGLEKCWLLSN